MTCLVLDDSARQLELVQFGQPTLLPAEAVKHMIAHTAADYPRLKYGFAVTCGDALAHCQHARFDPKEWCVP